MRYNRYNMENMEQQAKIIRLLEMTNSEKHYPSCEMDCIDKRDIIFNRSGLACRMLELLQTSIIPENVYQMKYLNMAYDKFEKKKSVLFSKQELFDEGWLVACRGEWIFNILNQQSFERIEHLPSEKDTQILSFLKELSKLSDSTQMMVRVSGKIECEELEDALTFIDGIAYLDPNGKDWLKYGKVIFGRWWDEIIETENLEEGAKNQQIERWFSCWDVFKRIWKPDLYCKHIGELFEICLKKLEAELENMSWELSEKIFRKKLYLENNQDGGNRQYSEFLEEYPKNKIQCALYVDRYSYFNLSDPPQKLSKLYYLCLRQYENVNIEYQSRFLKCIQNPWIYINFITFGGRMENIGFLTDCLTHPELYVPAVSAIWEMNYEVFTKIPSVGRKILEEMNQCLFEILDYKLKRENQEEWLSAVKDIVLYLNEKSSWFSKDTYMSKTGLQKYMQVIHDDYMKWYANNISHINLLHDKVLEYFYLEFESSSELDVVKAFAGYIILFGMQCKEETIWQLFEILQKFLKRIQIEDTLISVLPWSFWQEKVWIFMMREVAENSRETAKFLKLLEPELYKDQVDIQRKRNSALSRIGMAAMIQIYLMTILLIEGRDETGEKNRIEIEKAFVECILGVQIEDCDLFDPESVRILGTEIVMYRCMEIIPMLNVKNQTKFMNEMGKKSPEKLIFLLRYVQNPKMRQKWIQILILRIEENFTKNIFFIPTYMEIIDYLMEICFQGEDKEQKLAQKANELLTQFRQKVESKGVQVEKQYTSWIQSAEIRMKLLMREGGDILADGEDSSSTFYQGLIYLNREDLESLKKAEQLYAAYIRRKKIEIGSAPYINYCAACVRISTHKDISEAEKSEYIQKAEDSAKEIRDRYVLSISDLKILLLNEMYLYTMLNDHLKFWKSASLLPRELKYEFSCAKYVVQMLILEKDIQKAEEYIEELSLRYGETKEIERLQHELGEIAVSLEEKTPSVRYNESPEIEKYRNMLNRLKTLNDVDSALVRLQNDNLENPVEANLLEFVLNAVQQMEQYSDYLMYESQTHNENAYSKFVQIFFDQRGKDIWDYYLKDQTLEGTANDKLKNNFQSVGSADLFVFHNNVSIGIIETIKLQSINYEYIKKHIHKIFGYNYANVPTAFLLILADMSEPGRFWEEYENRILPKIIDESKDCVWYITEQTSKKNIELVKCNLVREPLYLCRTHHICDSTNQSLNLYHVMVDIKKAAAKKEAVDARRT